MSTADSGSRNPGGAGEPVVLPPLPDALRLPGSGATPVDPPAAAPPTGDPVQPAKVELPDPEEILRAAYAAQQLAASKQAGGGKSTAARGGQAPAGAIALTPSGGSPTLAPPPGADQPGDTTRLRKSLFSFAPPDGSAERDAEVMARIMAGKQERDAEADAVIARVAVATELERRETARARQRIAIEMYRAAQLRQAAEETPLQRVLRETAESFMALGMCPEHLEFLPDIGKFITWGGQVYDRVTIHSLRDRRGYPVYTFGSSPHGPATVCWSRRECGWRLDRALDPATKLTPIDRLVPTPTRREEGGYRFSAQRASTIIMEEGLATIYVAGNAVYTLSHLQAAHHRFSAAKAPDPSAAQRGSIIDRLGSIADSTVAATTRMFKKPD